jgi:endonuclease YncB( thermonuclease family)
LVAKGIRATYEPHGRYGSIVASCFEGAEDLNRWTVANDWAVAYRKYSRALRR